MARSNGEWITDLKSQQAAALVNLREVLVRNLRKAIGSRPGADDAFIEDVVQDSVLRILDRLDQFEGRSQFVTWSTSIAIRIAMSELRRSRWKDISLESVVTEEDWQAERAVDSGPSPESRVATQSIVDSMYEAINTALTEKQRLALLAELKGMPQDEVARHLGSSRNAIYKLTHDARKNLKKSLEAAGYSSDDLVEATSSVRA